VWDLVVSWPQAPASSFYFGDDDGSLRFFPQSSTTFRLPHPITRVGVAAWTSASVALAFGAGLATTSSAHRQYYCCLAFGAHPLSHHRAPVAAPGLAGHAHHLPDRQHPVCRVLRLALSPRVSGPFQLELLPRFLV
jgi:hypothetical protein